MSAERFFPPYEDRGPWAPGCGADLEWEKAMSAACYVWALRRGGVRLPIGALLRLRAIQGRLLFDEHPWGRDWPVASYLRPGKMAIALLHARVVHETSRFVQLAGFQWDRAGARRLKQTWFAAVDEGEGRAVLEKMATGEARAATGR